MWRGVHLPALVRQNELFCHQQQAGSEGTIQCNFLFDYLSIYFLWSIYHFPCLSVIRFLIR